MSLLPLVRSLLKSCLVAGLALAPLRAQGLQPAAKVEGRLRNFSPKGRYAVVEDGARLRVVDTATWKASEPLSTQGDPPDRFASICVDDAGRVVAFRAKDLQVYDFAGTPRLLFTLPNTPGFLAHPFVTEQGLMIRIVQVPDKPTSKEVLAYTKVLFVVKTRFHEPYFRYRVAPFSVPLEALVEACRQGGGAALEAPGALEALRRKAVPLPQGEDYALEDVCNGSDQGSQASVQAIEVSDSYWRVGVNRWAVGAVSASGGVTERVVWDQGWRFPRTLEAPRTAFRQINRPAHDQNWDILTRHAPSEFLLKEATLTPEEYGPWKVKPWGPSGRYGSDGLAAFTWSFTAPPSRVSADGRWVAARPEGGPRAWTTAIYAAEAVGDPFAGYAPDVLQDLLLSKIIGFIKAKNPAAALPYFHRLERAGVEQPQSFYYYRMQALEEVGRKADAQREAEAYLRRHGRQGEFYAEVIALLGRVQG